MNQQLGTLQRVALREIWPDEARDFTPWLASDENITLLGDAINLELEVEGQELGVGPYRADILCKDTSDDDHYVLIENQLEKTNHVHLGQLITYAAGLDAVTIVWIAEQFTDEHRAALDWLNRVTGEEVRLFGLEIELWQIGDSVAAPKFNIASSPNDWTKQRTASLSTGNKSELKQMYMDYWSSFRETLKTNYPGLKGNRPRAQHWNTFPVGRTKFAMHTSANSQQKWIRVEIGCTGPDSLAHFRLLENQKNEIEGALGMTLAWDELPNKKTCRISIHKRQTDPTDQSDWTNQHAWLAENLNKFNEVFRPRIRVLNADDYVDDDDDQDFD